MKLLSIAALMAGLAGCGANAAPEFTADGKLKFPADYRTWVYLSTGFGMAYTPMKMGEKFDNVFVDPDSYKAFLANGTWPDGTELVLEVRDAEHKGSLLKSGHYQGAVSALEVHTKDSARFKGGWGFFPFEDKTEPAAMLPPTANCYSCHQAHAAVDTTFVQFYPTLMPVAVQKKTLSPSYLATEEKH